MKKKLFIFAIISFLFLSFSYGQKVKLKKKIAYIDGVAYINLEDCDTQACTYKSMNGKEILIVQYNSFQKPNPTPRNPKYKGTYSSTVSVHYGKVRFLDFELEFEADLASSRKLFVKALYKNKVIDIEGNVSEINAKKFVMKYGKDISGNKPIQIISN